MMYKFQLNKKNTIMTDFVVQGHILCLLMCLYFWHIEV